MPNTIINLSKLNGRVFVNADNASKIANSLGINKPLVRGIVFPNDTKVITTSFLYALLKVHLDSFDNSYDFNKKFGIYVPRQKEAFVKKAIETYYSEVMS